MRFILSLDFKACFMGSAYVVLANVTSKLKGFFRDMEVYKDSCATGMGKVDVLANVNKENCG